MNSRAKLQWGKIARWSIVAAALIMVVAVIAMTCSRTAIAAADNDLTSDQTLFEKAAFQGLHKCYTSGHMNSPIDISDEQFSLKRAGSSSTSLKIALPYKMKNSMATPSVTCQQLYAGKKNSNQVIKYKGIQSLYSSGVDYTKYSSFGYKPKDYGSAGSRGCLSVNFSYQATAGGGAASATTNRICLRADGYGTIDPGSATIQKADESPYRLYLSMRETGGQILNGGTDPMCNGESGGVVFSLTYKNDQNNPQMLNNNFIVVCDEKWSTWSGNTITDTQLNSMPGGGMNKEQKITALTPLTVIGQASNNLGGLRLPDRIFDVSLAQEYNAVSGEVETVQIDSNKENAALTALRTITNKADNSFANYNYTNNDYVSLYLKYTTEMLTKFPSTLKYYNDDANCGKKSDMSGVAYIVPIQKTKEGHRLWCKITGVKEVSDKMGNVFGVEDGSKGIKLASFKDVLANLKKHSVASLKVNAMIGDVKVEDDKKDDDEEDEADQKEACQQAAGSLSWIICPVMTILNTATQGIYDQAIEPILEVNAAALRTTDGSGGSDGVYEAWKIFRNYANIAFAIALALVILSQLTGFGLSNYNIKKILPRLIMVIILVNVSFVLCQLAVDVSNVLGTVLKDTFISLSKQINDEVVDGGGNFFGGYVINGVMDVFLNGGTFALLGVAGVSAALNWHVWLVPLILILISFLLSILMFFIILAVRQAGVFILIVLAPVAIICYALPNTKSLFDKWYKLFVALLIVYPICGLMMGGGQFAAALLFKVGTQTDAGFFMLLTSVIVSVAPFFLIPSVVKNSMGALGNIGTKLSNFGSKAGSFLGGAFMGSRLGDRVKRRAGERAANVEENRAYRAQTRQFNRDRRFLDRMQRRIDNGETLSAEQQARVGRISSRTLATQRDRNANQLRGRQMFGAGGITELMHRQDRGQEDELERTETANTLAQYLHDEIGGVDHTQLEAAEIRDDDGHVVYDSNGLAERDLGGNSLEAEYNRQLDILQDHPEDATALRRVRALQQHFADQGDHGRAVIQRAFERRAVSGQTRGISVAAREIARDSKFLGNIKSGDRGLFAMVNDAADGSMQQHTGASAIAHYGSMGTDKYTAQSLAGADDGALDRLVSGVENGSISGGELSKLAGTAREALTNPNVQVKPEVEGRLRSIAMAGYAQGASSNATGGTAGSNAMANSSVANISSAASYIRSMNGGTRFDSTATAANNESYKMVQSMAQNAQTALRDSTKTYTQDQVKAMQDVIKAARDMGVKNDVNGTFNAVDSASIQIRGVEPRSMPTPPAGFSPSGIWVGGGAGPTPAQQAAVQDYLRERIAVERYNNRHGFGNPGGTP